MNLRRVESILRRYPDMAEADPMSDRDIITGTPNRVEGMPGGGGVGNPTLSLVMRMESEEERRAQVLAIAAMVLTLTPVESLLVSGYFWQGHTLEEVAETVGYKRQTARRRLDDLLERFGQAIFGGDRA